MNIVDLLLDSYKDFYKKKLAFNVFVIFVMVMMFYEKFSILFLISIGLSLYIVDIIIEYYYKSEGDDMNKILHQLDEINDIVGFKNTDYLFVDSSMINYIHSILWLEKYNKNLFEKFLQGVNNILKLRYEVEETDNQGKVPVKIKSVLRVVHNLKYNTINNLTSFIHTIPSDRKLYKKLKTLTIDYQKLVSKNIFYIEKIYKKFEKKK